MSVQGCATIQVHKCLGVQMYRCTSAYECIGVQVYGCAGVQVYGCTGMYNCIGEYCYFYFKMQKKILKMMLTYHISPEKFFSTALSVPVRSGVKLPFEPWDLILA